MAAPVRWLVLGGHVPASGALGGMVRYAVELLNALSRRDDVEVHVTSQSESAEALAARFGGRAHVHPLPQLPRVLRPTLERLLLPPSLPSGFDVIHGVKHLVPRRTAALRVLTVHDMFPLDRRRDFSTLKRRLLPPAYRASIRDADLLLSVSDATRTRLLDRFPQFATKTTTVPLAMSSSLRDTAASPVARLAGKRFALVVGDVTQRKNVGTVVDVWPEVVARFPDAVLAVAGPPDWGPSDQGRRFAEGLRNGSVQALGHISDAELRWCYESATVVLCPSLAEGFGLPVVEAIGFGAPVIISSDPAQVESAAGMAAAVVAPLDAMAWRDTILTVLASPREDRRHQRPPRTWDDVADATVAAVAEKLRRRRN